MKMSIGDLRYRTHKVFRVLERGEDVSIVSRGKVIGVIKPVNGKSRMRVQDHPFFNMLKSPETVEQQMDRLRGGRKTIAQRFIAG
ncbi:MAG: type II toxin-antitoxin system Phd/YefM family antitoxin [Planctomycetes bacterium]|nr:type II toxin-antitoxin system Phd/YefM family antitoxin [Planctomycetota bacterium]